MREAFEHCAALVREADKDRFLATLFAPADRRDALYALYAFNAEVARVPEAVREPLAGEIRLQWWRDVLAGARAEEASGHPVAAALGEVIRQHRLPAPRREALIDARRYDLGQEVLRDADDLEAYAHDTSAILVEMAARILGADTAALGFAAPVGISIALTGLRRAFVQHAAQGQVFIPADVLGRHGVEPHDILAGRSSEGLLAALHWMRERAAFHQGAARGAIERAPLAVAAAWLPAALVPAYWAALDRSRSEPFRAVDVPQWRRQWTLWRAARTGRIGSL
jgi:15-cis-phytoene synthase